MALKETKEEEDLRNLYETDNMTQQKIATFYGVSFCHYIYDNSQNLFLSHKKDRFEELIGRQLA